MPIVSRTNNRVLPANERTADVARAAVNDLAKVERNKYHNAFKVTGVQGILYHALTCGQRCHCRDSLTSINTRLGLDGKATPGFMNELLTGGLEFGILPYAMKPADQANSDPDFRPRSTAAKAVVSDPYPSNGSFKIDQSLVDPVRVSLANASTPAKPNLPSLYDSDGIDELGTGAGTPFDLFTKDPETHPGATVTPDGVGGNGPINDMEFEDILNADGGAYSATDLVCPICMGTGYVNGFNVFNGWRRILSAQDEGSIFDGPVNFEEAVPTIECKTATFNLTLPAHVVGIDALRVWNMFEVVSPVITIDDIQLTTQQSLMSFCDGKAHTLKLTFSETSTFTHVELQVNQSLDTYLFDLPKVTRSSMRDKLQNLQEMTILVSPKVPLIRPGDFIAESTYNTVLAVGSVPQWNTSSRTVLGWECETRPVQPQDLHNLLPRRPFLAVPNAPPLVRDNMTGHRRT